MARAPSQARLPDLSRNVSRACLEPIRVTRLLIPSDPAALRANNFDALRLAMALLVVWSHCFALWRGSEASEPLSRLFAGAHNAGSIAVLVFFTVSGFLITLSWDRSPGALSFLRKRVARIYPGYLVAISLCSLLVIPLFSSRGFAPLAPHEIAGLASNLLLRNYLIPSDAFGGGAVNGALWSIPYEFWCYLGVLALGLSGLATRRWLLPAMALLLMLFRAWLDWSGRYPVWGWFSPIFGLPIGWAMVGPSFLWGATAYRYAARIPRSGTALAAMLVVLIAGAHLPLPGGGAAMLAHALVPPVLAYAVFFVAFSPALPLHGAARFGDFSYGTYLYGFPVQRILQWELAGRIPFALYVPLALAAALAAGVASWFLVERWFLARVRRPRPLQEELVLVAP